MRLEHLQYVKTISQHSSLSQAAETLYLNQPTLSRALAVLEKELDITLFTRNYQGIVPTEICQKILPHFEQILSEVDAVQALIACEKSKDISGTLTVSAGSILCSNILLDISTAFNQSYPLIAVDILEAYSSEIIQQVQKKHADAGFLTSVHNANDNLLTTLARCNLTYEFLLQTPTVAVLASTSPLAAQEKVSYADLRAYPLFLNKKIHAALTPDMDNAAYHYCPDRESRNKMIIKQQGYCIVSPLEMWNDFYVEQGLLVLRPLLEEDIYNQLDLGLIYRQDRTLRPYEEDFLTLVRQFFQSFAA